LGINAPVSRVIKRVRRGTWHGLTYITSFVIINLFSSASKEDKHNDQK
jgi:hypothetical protein